MRTIDFISETHLGDCVFLTDFLNKMIKIDEDIVVNFYIFEKHRLQIEEIIEDKERVRPCRYDKAPSTSYRAWMAQYGQIKYIPFNFDQLKMEFYRLLCQEFKLKNPYSNIEDLLYDSFLLKEKEKDESYDILLLNSDPLSNQLGGKQLNCDAFIEKFKNKKIITTKKIKDIPCTLDMNYSILDIAKLSLKVNKIIGIHTGPWHVIMNKQNYNMNKPFYYIDNNCFYTYKNTFNIKNLDIFI
jgi:hypothetical protein